MGKRNYVVGRVDGSRKQGRRYFATVRQASRYLGRKGRKDPDVQRGEYYIDKIAPAS